LTMGAAADRERSADEERKVPSWQVNGSWD